jgi:hypothetical protein
MVGMTFSYGEAMPTIAWRAAVTIIAGGSKAHDPLVDDVLKKRGQPTQRVVVHLLAHHRIRRGIPDAKQVHQ